MTLDLSAIESLAPDQSSLKAAAGLTKAGKWSGTGTSTDGTLLWGACAGSGANPYRVMADLSDLGSKCTCPSRKFPCKHVLAMLWMHVDGTMVFGASETPDWVSEWLGRRRKGTSAAPGAAAPVATKDMRAALAVDPEQPDDPKAVARRQSATDKRARETRAAIVDALDALDQWIGDQLRLGLFGFLDDATARCRRIAARMVDGKAQTLGGRIDELPSRVLALPAGDRVRGAVAELAKLVLLSRAWRAAPDDPEIARAVATAETREQVLENAATLRVTAFWEVVGERIETRRDGLVSLTTWLLNLTDEGPRFAMLVDYFPASAGKRGSAFTTGEQFEGELAFYAGQRPLRALLARRCDRLATEARKPWCATTDAVTDAISAGLQREPWLSDLPVVLPSGRIAVDDGAQGWWRAAASDLAFPVTDLPEGLIRATDLEHAAAIWSNGSLRLLAAQTRWGPVHCVG
ncbi:MAG: SWIM zinc finger domain-containing protein [Sphingomonas sp.]|uniref:SWIM zinc finger family protein n=1 Tax=Sphingomonas sp. TaxID=28214 RepID=UPI0025FC1B48|nr:SWIM zinc finger family protein [Sphingomonas sp.]MBY0285321.1 SWIM zinc finger domain-containing protein [Sphingomonas sp.]